MKYLREMWNVFSNMAPLPCSLLGHHDVSAAVARFHATQKPKGVVCARCGRWSPR